VTVFCTYPEHEGQNPLPFEPTPEHPRGDEFFPVRKDGSRVGWCRACGPKARARRAAEPARIGSRSAYATSGKRVDVNGLLAKAAAESDIRPAYSMSRTGSGPIPTAIEKAKVVTKAELAKTVKAKDDEIAQLRAALEASLAAQAAKPTRGRK
jgi:hypothetical protein